MPRQCCNTAGAARHTRRTEVFPCRYSVAIYRLGPDERRSTASPERSCRSQNRAGTYGSSPLAPIRLCADSSGWLFSHDCHLTSELMNDPTTTSTEELLTPAEAAILARCSVRTLRRAYTSGGLGAYRSPGGRSVRLLRHEVVAYFLAEPAGMSPLSRTRPKVKRMPERPARVVGDPLSVARIRAQRA